jgi:hypothetical protein
LGIWWVDCYSSNNSSSLRGKSMDMNTRKGKIKEMMARTEQLPHLGHRILESSNRKLDQESTLGIYTAQAILSQ